MLDGFSGDARPDDDLETLRLELLVADRDHVERRHERVHKEAKSGDAAKRVEAETLAALLAHLDGGKTLADWPDTPPAALDPLTTKPLIAVENGPGDRLQARGRLADLSDEEAAEFRRAVRPRRGRTPLKDALGLIASSRRREGDAGMDAPRRSDRARCGHDDPLRHRARLHPLRGDLGGDLLDAGSHAEAASAHATTRGQDLRGRHGDVLNIRFNVYERREPRCRALALPIPAHRWRYSAPVDRPGTQYRPAAR